MFARFFVVLLAAVVTVAGCSGGGDSAPRPSPTPTPIERLNTAQMVLPRIDFCSLVTDATLADALGTKTWRAQAWNNGQSAPVGGERTDVVAEHQCEWQAKDDSATARAWSFARPVAAPFAQRVVREARRTPGCRTPSAPDFGRPSVLQVCDRDGTQRVRRAGLFADTWFTCEISAPSAEAADLRARTDDFCGALVTQLNTTK